MSQRPPNLPQNPYSGGNPGNPYSRPTKRRDLSSYNPLDKLRPPAISLMIVSVIGIIGHVGLFIFELATERITAETALSDVGGALFVIANQLVIIGACTTMLSGRSFSNSMVGAIIACVPCCSPCIVLGIPFGIWALVVMNQPDVRNAFRA